MGVGETGGRRCVQAVEAGGGGGSAVCLKAQAADVEIRGPIGNEPLRSDDSEVGGGEAFDAGALDDEETGPFLGDLMSNLKTSLDKVCLYLSAVVLKGALLATLTIFCNYS